MKTKLSLIIITFFLISIIIPALGGSNNIEKNKLSYNKEIENSPDVIDYIITAKDKKEYLNEDKIDSICDISLEKGKEIDLSKIKIVLFDGLNYFESKIIQSGLWRVEEIISIQEIMSNQIKANYYKLYLLDINNKPISSTYISIDNSQEDDLKFLNLKTRSSAMLGMEDYKTSVCYNKDSYNRIISVLGAGLEYAGRSYNSFSDVWEYLFKFDTIFSTTSLYEPYICLDKISLYTNDRQNVNNIGYHKVGGWNVDEESQGDYNPLACFIVGQVLDVVNPLASFIMNLAELVDSMKDTPDIIWETPTASKVEYATGFAYFELYVDPCKTWYIKFNVDAIETCQLYYISLDGSGDTDYTQGKIIYGETSPAEPTFKITNPQKGYLYYGDKHKFGPFSSPIAIVINNRIIAEAYDYGIGVDKVKFTVDNEEGWDSIPTGGYYTVDLVPHLTGYKMLKVVAYNIIGDEIANDEVRVIFIKYH